jgi:Predicted nucleic acid-binding protein, contains PIN domain
MAKAVCNSSPIIGLSIIGRLDLLWQIFNEVFIPEEVYNEVINNNRYKNFGENELKEALEKKNIKVYKIQNTAFVDQMYGRLHRGELEVMIAAKELKINRVIIDDRSARNFSETMLLKSIGLIGILIAAKKIGLITEVKKYLDLLINEEYRISKKLYFEALKDAGEEGLFEI